MKVLSIGLDKKVLDKSSKTFKRFQEYVRLIDELHVVVFGPEKELKEGNLFVYGSGEKAKFLNFFKAYKKARKILSNKDLSDWLITTQDPFFAGFLGYLLKRKFGIKLHVQLHGDFFSSKYFRKECLYNRFQYILGKFIIKKADGFRVVSQRVKKSLVKLGISEEKITAVPIYAKVKSSAYAKASADRRQSKVKSQKLNKFVFLTAGRLVLVKNIGLQIKAMAEIVKKYPNTELWIVGDGPMEKKIQDTKNKIQTPHGVKLFGWRNDLDKFYSQADAFLLTSNYEGWGLVVIEASTYGLPIIMTDVGCAGEVIKNGESGIVIPIGDRKALEEAMIKIIEDSELRKKLGQGAQKAVKQLPSKQETLELYKKSWQQCIKQ